MGASSLKEPLTYEEQIQHLIVEHGLVISDSQRAQDILKSVNYYRLSAYGIGLIDKETDRYPEDTSIEQLYSLYVFDSNLRNIISPVIEFVEVRLRSIIAYHLAIKYGPECYRDRIFFSPWFSQVKARDMFDVFNENVDAEIQRQSKKPMVKHHNDKYGGHFPIWVVVELLSLGSLSTLYSIMKREDQNAVAAQFNADYAYMKSWFAALVELRNICAHYGRLYNMPLDSLAKLPPNEKQYAHRRLFTNCLALKYITSGRDVWDTFLAKFKTIVNECPQVNLHYIGFPKNWEEILQAR